MPDFDLDSLKRTWQQQEVMPKYDNSEILQMLNKKSRNYVKYILWISVIEFLLILGVTLFYITSEKEGEDFIHILERLGIQKTPEILMNLDHIYLAVKILSVGIIAIFVVKFYLSYRKISIESNLKKFILQIIGFKKTVNLFIFTNILFLVIVTGVFTFLIFNALSSQNISVSQETMIGFVFGIVIAMTFSVTLIWLYYRIVYGIIVSRLTKNLEQLKEIEEQEV